ncbi:uncharacterized protein [Amphiura filiformis]|uniref:uncharacterized protein n=1 Tax=Amphiura filiformis TaxID=82378 RepID=UPI003B20B9F7
MADFTSLEPFSPEGMSKQDMDLVLLKTENLRLAEDLKKLEQHSRLNLSYIDLGLRFNISDSTVSNIVSTWICVLNEILVNGMMGNQIPSVAKNQLCLPGSFHNFSNCRIVLDCTEVQCAQVRDDMSVQKETFSNYKSRNTFKALVGVAPNGVITYVSNLYPGSRSDKAIVQHCGVLSQLVPGDLVLADKGFLILDDMPQGVSLNLPPFL